MCATTGSDGLCGTTAAPPPQPQPGASAPRPEDPLAGVPTRGRIASVAQGRRFARAGPARCWRAPSRSEAPGSRDVRLRLTRKDGHRCARFDAGRERFVRTRRCGPHARHVLLGGRRAPAWRYLLPARLPARPLRPGPADRRPRRRRRRSGSCAAARGWCSSSDERAGPPSSRRCAALAAGAAGCGLGAGGDAVRRRAEGHARVRTRAVDRADAPRIDGARHRDAAAAAQREGHDALRRRLRAVHRRRSPAGARAARPSTGSTTSTASRRARARRRRRSTTATASGGTAATGRRRQDVPAVVGLVPRAVRARRRAASGCRCASSAPTRRRPRAGRVQGRLTRPGPRRAPSATLGASRVGGDAARRRRAVGRGSRGDAAVGLHRPRPRRQRRLRALRRTAAARSQLAGPGRARAPDRRPGRGPGGGRARRGRAAGLGAHRHRRGRRRRAAAPPSTRGRSRTSTPSPSMDDAAIALPVQPGAADR